jgi:hypothetical protein
MEENAGNPPALATAKERKREKVAVLFFFVV